MPIHQLRIARLAQGVQVDDFVKFFHRDEPNGLRAELRKVGIPFVGAWKTAERADEVAWLRTFVDAAQEEAASAKLYDGAAWTGGLRDRARAIFGEITTLELDVLDASGLARGPRDRGFHELRHYRLAPGKLPAMLAFFEDVRRLMPEHGVRVLGWWSARIDGADRFLWLREFADAAHKARAMKEIYESPRWLADFKPRAMGVIEERILKDLEPIAAARIGAYEKIAP